MTEFEEAGTISPSGLPSDICRMPDNIFAVHYTLCGAASQKVPDTFCRVADTDEARTTGKWNGYSTEKDDFEFAREYWQGNGKTVEAALMDWADDIAYSVHDLEDFHRCGMIPWHKIFGASGRELVVRSALKAWRNAPRNAEGRLRKAYDRLRDLIEGLTDIVREPYEALRAQRQELRELTSQLIGRFVGTISLRIPTRANDSCVKVDKNALDEVSVLKQLTRDYVLQTPSLAAQQKGQQKILKDLFEIFIQDVESGNPSYVPRKFHHIVEQAGVSNARKACDCIASLSEAETMALHARLHGYSGGSVLDPIVR